MDYSANDQDVQKYLEILNIYSIKLDNATETEGQNLKKLIEVVQEEIKELRYSQIEKLNHLIQRKLIVDNRIKSLYDNKYNTNYLETRYNTYKADSIDVLTEQDSKFMRVANQIIDIDLNLGLNELIDYRREQSLLLNKINIFQEQKDYLKDIYDEFDVLKSKIDSL